LIKIDDYGQEIVDIGRKIDEIEDLESPMHNFIYSRDKLLKILRVYKHYLEDLNKAINFTKGS